MLEPPAAWAALAERAIPSMFRDVFDGWIRAWTPGCTAAADAYGAALLLYEHRQRAGSHARVAVFGTDTDAGALGAARRGLFPPDALGELSRERLDAHFRLEAGGYRVASHLRDVVLLSSHDPRTDPPFLRLHLVVARGLFRSAVEERAAELLELLHFSLRPDGVLLLLDDDAPEVLGEYFEPMDGAAGLYARRASLPSGSRQRTREAILALSVAGVHHRACTPGSVAQAVAERILDEHAPANVTVNEQGDILQLNGATREWLELPAGRPEMNIFRLARRRLRGELRSAVARCVREGCPVTYDTGAGDSGSATRITVEPLVHPDDGSRLALVLFERLDGEAESSDRDTDVENKLRRRLASNEEHLRHTIEELQVAHEELSGYYADLAGTTEELHVANEDLRASKVALEEANDTLSAKIAELERVNDDLRNFFTYSDIATLLLDEDMTIRRFTPRAAEIIAVRDEDIGRPVTDLALQLIYGDLAHDVQEVLLTQAEHRRHVRHRDGRVFEARIAPCRTARGRAGGVAVSFVDVSAIAEELRQTTALAHMGEMAAAVAHEVRNPLAGIRGAIEIIGRGLPADSQEAEVVETIVRRIESLDGMVTDLLTFAAPIEIERAPTSLRAVVERAAQQLAVHVPDVDVEITGTDATADVDERVIRHVAFNLLLNAAQAMEGEGTVHVRIARLGSTVHVRVRDEGPGIAPDMRDRMFEPFVTSRPRGVGLGLAFARRAVLAHGGTIEAEHDAAGGAVIDIVLPVHPTPEDPEE